MERSRVSRLSEDGDKQAKRIFSGLTKLSFHLSGAQLGITLSSLVLGLVAGQTLGAVVQPVLEWFGISADLLSALTITLVVSIEGEIRS